MGISAHCFCVQTCAYFARRRLLLLNSLWRCRLPWKVLFYRFTFIFLWKGLHLVIKNIEISHKIQSKMNFLLYGWATKLAPLFTNATFRFAIKPFLCKQTLIPAIKFRNRKLSVWRLKPKIRQVYSYHLQFSTYYDCISWNAARDWIYYSFEQYF